MTIAREYKNQEAKDIEDRSPHFHDIIKNCEMKLDRKFLRKIYSKGRWVAVYMEGQRCKTHENVWCCRCGWEFGYHMNSSSRRISQQINNRKI